MLSLSLSPPTGSHQRRRKIAERDGKPREITAHHDIRGDISSDGSGDGRGGGGSGGGSGGGVGENFE